MIWSDDTKAVLALTTRLGDRRRPSLSPGEWHRVASRLADEGKSPARLFSDDGGDEAIRSLLADTPAVLVEAGELAQRGIWVRSITDDDFPTRLHRLGAQTPPIIFGVGAADLLDEGGIGVVGSRDVSPEGAAVARAVAEHAAAHRTPLVSGGARGVDRIAMNAAYQAGGAVVGVLADSLLQRIRSTETLHALDAGSTCLISAQHPGAGFTPAAAMSRNKLIYALADVTVVVATDLESGGTWAGATEALRRGYGTVAVWRGEGEGPGNAEIKRRGAIPFSNVEDLSAIRPTDPASEQLRLID